MVGQMVLWYMKWWRRSCRCRSFISQPRRSTARPQLRTMHHSLFTFLRRRRVKPSSDTTDGEFGIRTISDPADADVDNNETVPILERDAASEYQNFHAANPAAFNFNSDIANTTAYESTVSFKYPKLNNADGHFRIMALEPSKDFSADIKCHVYNQSRHSNPKYEALSYRWGSPKDTVPIYVRLTAHQDEQESDKNPYLSLSVTRNLEQALRALRLPDRVRLLWVDALCINQNDELERGQQVRMMTQIYQRCVRDLLWLGPENVQISRAMKLIPKIQGHGENIHGRTCKSMFETECTTFSAFSDQDWNDLESLVLHPEVWDRVWIIQELILSPKFTLVCGKDTLDWNCIDSVLENNRDMIRLFELPDLMQRTMPVLGKVNTIRTYRMSSEITSSLFSKTLLTTFFFFLDWKATDKRDKVYAILSLTTDGKDIEVNYQKTMDQLSIDFATTCITQGNMGLLSHSTNYFVSKSQYLKQHPNSHGNNTTEAELLVPRRKGWPTWIPDLSDDIIENAKVSGLSISGTSTYKACGSMECMDPLQVSHCNIIPSLELLMGGIFVDSVALVNPITLVSGNETRRDRWIRDVLAWAPPETRQLNASSYLYPWSDTKLETIVTAYWRTIVTDRRLDKRLTTEDLSEVSWYMDISESSDVPEENIALAGWRFGKTVAGMYCMLPPQSKVGDTICVPMGGKVPLLLRPRSGDREVYELIGESYVHGVMDGMGMLRAVSNLDKMMQADQNHDFEHMHRRLKDETVGTQFYMKTFVIA